jgi:hypothetical protein
MHERSQAPQPAAAGREPRLIANNRRPRRYGVDTAGGKDIRAKQQSRCADRKVKRADFTPDWNKSCLEGWTGWLSEALPAAAGRQGRTAHCQLLALSLSNSALRRELVATSRSPLPPAAATKKSKLREEHKRCSLHVSFY